MKTYSPKATHIHRKWHLIDAKNQVLGRLSTDIATKLIGKHKPYFTPHLDCGDYVVVVNAANIRVTGNKLHTKKYHHHSGYPGGLKSTNLKTLLHQNPLKVIEHSVNGMLPKNKLRTPRLRRLKVFATSTHPYQDKLNQ